MSEVKSVWCVGVQYEGVIKVFANEADAREFLANDEWADYIEEMEIN